MIICILFVGHCSSFLSLSHSLLLCHLNLLLNFNSDEPIWLAVNMNDQPQKCCMQKKSNNYELLEHKFKTRIEIERGGRERGSSKR